MAKVRLPISRDAAFVLENPNMIGTFKAQYTEETVSSVAAELRFVAREAAHLASVLDAKTTLSTAMAKIDKLLAEEIGEGETSVDKSL
jgi:hypothetical protein